MEVLVPGSKGKRGTVVKPVKSALAASGHADPQSVANDLDDLYVARNSLIAKPVTHSQLVELKEIVRRSCWHGVCSSLTHRRPRNSACQSLSERRPRRYAA